MSSQAGVTRFLMNFLAEEKRPQEAIKDADAVIVSTLWPVYKDIKADLFYSFYYFTDYKRFEDTGPLHIDMKPPPIR